MRQFAFVTFIICTAAATPLVAQNRIDGQSSDAPALAAYGTFAVGVRKLEFVNKDQIDIVTLGGMAPKPNPLPVYDRPVTVEVWYPALAGSMGDTSIDAVIRDGQTVELHGKAVRDAAPDAGPAKPLLLLSHGYPGNRFLMSHLAENLASKGYVVASIDHTDSTYSDQSAFASTLVNRPLDQVFVLNEMARLNNDAGSFLAGKVDTDNTALLGYSMGGYGTLITAGAGVTPFATAIGAPYGTLGIHQAGSATHEALPDPRIKTAIAIGPWGRQFGLWDAAGLAGIEIPMLVIGGSNDIVSQYTNGIRKIWKEAVNSERALLTFKNGSHNTVAPIPAPEESNYFNAALGFNVSEHYSDPVWDSVFMNNVGQHFLTAWLDKYLKGDLTRQQYLDLVAKGKDGLWSQNQDGSFAQDHTYWAGFKEGTAQGLKYEVLRPVPAPVPLPATVWLFGLALGGLAVVQRRRAPRA